jgi:hypothetical protein
MTFKEKFDLVRIYSRSSIKDTAYQEIEKTILAKNLNIDYYNKHINRLTHSEVQRFIETQRFLSGYIVYLKTLI